MVYMNAVKQKIRKDDDEVTCSSATTVLASNKKKQSRLSKLTNRIKSTMRRRLKIDNGDKDWQGHPWLVATSDSVDAISRHPAIQDNRLIRKYIRSTAGVARKLPRRFYIRKIYVWCRFRIIQCFLGADLVSILCTLPPDSLKEVGFDPIFINIPDIPFSGSHIPDPSMESAIQSEDIESGSENPTSLSSGVSMFSFSDAASVAPIIQVGPITQSVSFDTGISLINKRTSYMDKIVEESISSPNRNSRSSIEYVDFESSDELSPASIYEDSIVIKSMDIEMTLFPPLRGFPRPGIGNSPSSQQFFEEEYPRLDHRTRGQRKQLMGSKWRRTSRDGS